ncbi:hypothetical protein [Nonomuraea sp. NPDC048826]|uniref:hypothetical protein n=1 Tax=Nonomuraea sp. NPDC048826 TaxID=3364347 RepID=UPI0037241508
MGRVLGVERLCAGLGVERLCPKWAWDVEIPWVEESWGVESWGVERERRGAAGWLGGGAGIELVNGGAEAE